MLILKRRARESIRIWDHVRVTVLEVKGRQVKLGIEAPADMAVDREEIHIRKLNAARHAGVRLAETG
jgi:carbon storage regulator